MSFLKSLFGGRKAAEDKPAGPVKSIEHNGFTIHATPYQEGGQFYIGVIRPDGTGERKITQSYQDEGPTWSPNGRVIAFAREAGPGAGSKLWTIDLTGRNLRRLATPGDASDPAWSPLLK